MAATAAIAAAVAAAEPQESPAEMAIRLGLVHHQPPPFAPAAPAVSGPTTASIAAASAATASMSLNTSGDSLSTEEEDGGGGGEGVNGHANASASAANKEGKLTLTALLEEGLVEPGVGVMSIDYLGQVSRSR